MANKEGCTPVVSPVKWQMRGSRSDAGRFHNLKFLWGCFFFLPWGIPPWWKDSQSEIPHMRNGLCCRVLSQLPGTRNLQFLKLFTHYPGLGLGEWEKGPVHRPAVQNESLCQSHCRLSKASLCYWLFLFRNNRMVISFQLGSLTFPQKHHGWHNCGLQGNKGLGQSSIQSINVDLGFIIHLLFNSQLDTFLFMNYGQ